MFYILRSLLEAIFQSIISTSSGLRGQFWQGCIQVSTPIKVLQMRLRIQNHMIRNLHLMIKSKMGLFVVACWPKLANSSQLSHTFLREKFNLTLHFALLVTVVFGKALHTTRQPSVKMNSPVTHHSDSRFCNQWNFRRLGDWWRHPFRPRAHREHWPWV